jgi:hypothetical protein
VENTGLTYIKIINIFFAKLDRLMAEPALEVLYPASKYIKSPIFRGFRFFVRNPRLII